MKPSHRHLKLVLIPALLLNLPACSKPTESFEFGVNNAKASLPASQNAALRYWEAWWELGPEAFPSFWDQLKPVREGEDPDRTVESKPVSERGIELLMAAASMEHCDFGVNIALNLRDDSDTTISGDHYWLLLNSFNLLVEEAQAALASGDSEGASRKFLAAMLMLDHAAQQPEIVFMTSLPAGLVDVLNIVESVQEQFSAPDRAILARALPRFDGEDPFRIAKGFRVFANASATAVRNGAIDNEAGLDPADLQQFAENVQEFMTAEDDQLEKLWLHMNLDEQNPVRQQLEPVVLGLRKDQAEALRCLNWLRNWSSQ